MSRPIAKIDYKDEIVNLGNRAAQMLGDLQLIGSQDLYRIAPAVVQLKAAMKDCRATGNAKDENPAEQLDVLLRKLRLASENLDRASALLSEHRSTIAELLK